MFDTEKHLANIKRFAEMTRAARDVTPEEQAEHDALTAALHATPEWRALMKWSVDYDAAWRARHPELGL